MCTLSNHTINCFLRKIFIFHPNTSINICLKYSNKKTRDKNDVLCIFDLILQVHIMEESSDDEVESESPLYDTYIIHESVTPVRHRAHSLSSGSSGGDLGDVTPCNAISPGLVPHQLANTIYRNPHEDSWRSTILSSLRSVPFNQPLQLVYRSNSILKVSSFFTSFLMHIT